MSDAKERDMENAPVVPVGAGTETVGKRGRRSRPTLTPEESAARQARRVQIAGYIGLVVVVGIAATMSWTGLSGFGRDVLRLPVPLVYGVPVSLDVAAMVCGALALRSVVHHDSAAGPRFLTFLLVLGSAGANYYEADRRGGVAAALYFGAMSVLSWWLWDVVLRQIRRGMLRTIGAVESPLPKFRAIRWLRFPRETFAAWSLAVRYGLTRPEDALSRVWQAEQARELETLDTLPENITKGEALRMAFAATSPGDVPAALEWLADRGLTVDRSYAYEVARKLEPAQLPKTSPRMAAAG